MKTPTMTSSIGRHCLVELTLAEPKKDDIDGWIEEHQVGVVCYGRLLSPQEL
jgi:hypothetical protein